MIVYSNSQLTDWSSRTIQLANSLVYNSRTRNLQVCILELVVIFILVYLLVSVLL